LKKPVKTFEFNARPSVMTVFPLRGVIELTNIDFTNVMIGERRILIFR
jgi:hypothetical protein